MAFIKITPQHLQGKGVTNLPDVPGLTAEEMQAKFDELSREVIVPAFNANVEALQEETAAQEIGTEPPQGVTPEPLPPEGQPAKLSSVLKGIVNFCKEFVQGFAYSKNETDAQIDAKVVEIGTGDMARAVYDTNRDGIVDKADLAKAAENGCFEYAHTKADTVHKLTGTGENIKFTATADYAMGESFTVNGTAVITKNLVGFKAGDIVLCFLNGNEIDFNQHYFITPSYNTKRWNGKIDYDGNKIYTVTWTVDVPIGNFSFLVDTNLKTLYSCDYIYMLSNTQTAFLDEATFFVYGQSDKNVVGVNKDSHGRTLKIMFTFEFTCTNM